MATTLVLAKDARRLFPSAKKGDLVEHPFRSGRIRIVQDVFPTGDISLIDHEAASPGRGRHAPPPGSAEAETESP
jgi:hypothetical protein